MGITVRMSWPLRKEAWFWLLMLLLMALHIVAAMAFKWSAAAYWTGLTIMPFMAADIGLTLAVVYLVYRVKSGVPAQLFTPPDRRYADDVD
jgi:NADH:ubiquinone oxidoreductase subunit 3 (subunit A)